MRVFFCFVSENHTDGETAAKEIGVRPIRVWKTSGNDKANTVFDNVLDADTVTSSVHCQRRAMITPVLAART